jgi:hypothetical protein
LRTFLLMILIGVLVRVMINLKNLQMRFTERAAGRVDRVDVLEKCSRSSEAKCST